MARRPLLRHAQGGSSAAPPPPVDPLSCDDAQFDSLVSRLDTRGLVRLIRSIQDAMSSEQEAFEALGRRLDSSKDVSSRQELSVQLCTRQAHLAQLCARNLRCFLQHQEQQQQQKKNQQQEQKTSPAPPRPRPAGQEPHLAIRRIFEEKGARSQFQEDGFYSLPRRRPLFRPPSWDSLERPGGATVDDPTTTSSTGESVEVEEGRTHRLLRSWSALDVQQLDVSDDDDNWSVRRRGGRRGEGSVLKRAPSVEEILASVKALRHRRRHPGDEEEEEEEEEERASMGMLGKEEQPCYANVVVKGGVVRGAADGAEERHYENVARKGASGGDSFSVPVYANLCEDTVYENVRVPVTYDVPRSASHVYDAPRSSSSSTKKTTTSSSLVPQAARLVKLLKAAPKHLSHEEEEEECEADSLEGGVSEPEIPSPGGPQMGPDYGSEEEEEDFEEEEEEDASDEGLGESDARSFYAEDPGLEVILEEPEEEDGVSTTRGEDLVSLQATTTTVNGTSSSTSPTASSEGIWSGDGDVEDSGRTGRRPSDVGQQKDRCVEVYQETLRQRGMRGGGSSTNVGSTNKAGRRSSPSTSEELPSVRALRSQFEQKHDGNNVGRMAVRPSQPPPPPPATTTTSTVHGRRADREPEVSRAAHDDDVIRMVNGDRKNNGIQDNVDGVDGEHTPRVCTKHWDPTALLATLYRIPEVKASSVSVESSSTPYMNMEGYLDVLPPGRKKATYWNAWKRRYIRAREGVLEAYESAQSAEDGKEPPLAELRLSGGSVEVSQATTLVNGEDGHGRQPMMACILGVDDGRGRYLALRTPSQQDCERWRRALLTHTPERCDAHVLRPWPLPREPQLFRPAVVIEFGSCSVRAGRLCTQPVLPQLFFPSVASVHNETGKIHFGRSALHPSNRSSSSLHYPLRPSPKISQFSFDSSFLPGLLHHIFSSLHVSPHEVGVLLVLPRRFPPKALVELTTLVLEQMECEWLALAHQSLMVLYAYGAASGVVVDIGERTDVMVVAEGYQLFPSDTRLSCGGRRLAEQLRPMLAQRHIMASGEMETLLLRLVTEQLCYVARDYAEEMRQASFDPEECAAEVKLRDFFSEQECPWDSIAVDVGRFQAPEGLFQPSLWGLDQPGLHRLVYNSIQECGLDLRREMARSIFLAGGVSQLPGLGERLQGELEKLMPQGVAPRVHSSPFRYHAAFLGASQMANQQDFKRLQVSREEWRRTGVKAISRWHL